MNFSVTKVGQNQIFDASTATLVEKDKESGQSSSTQSSDLENTIKVGLNNKEREEIPSNRVRHSKRKRISTDPISKGTGGSRSQKIRNQYKKMESGLKEIKEQQRLLDENQSMLDQRLEDQEIGIINLHEQFINMQTHIRQTDRNIADVQADFRQRDRNINLLTMNFFLIYQRQLAFDRLIMDLFLRARQL